MRELLAPGVSEAPISAMVRGVKSALARVGFCMVLVRRLFVGAVEGVRRSVLAVNGPACQAEKVQPPRASRGHLIREGLSVAKDWTIA